ncbi:MAG TPA: sigma-70 family RNA polymerase sigma factor [Hyphomicrobiales bacterium]|nr:sigma-70 family RNA polymerase sigma factor [Hyphomicrobiales bacterium]
MELDRKSAIAQELPRLRRYARALLRDPSEADDLVQDCVTRALEKIAQWREDEPRRWLFAIMHNLFVDQSRARRRQSQMAQVSALAPGEAHEPPRQLDRLVFADVMDALQALPEDRREALVLVGVEGMSYRDAAAVLGVPVGTLMSRLGRGRAQLRALIGENGGRPGHLRSVE